MAAGINSMQSFVMQIMLVLREAIGGYRFSPSDEELINFLKSENPGYREDFCIIPTIGNIYETNPWDLPEKFNENSMIPSNGREWWFICPHMQNQRNCRKTPSNYSWKITGKSTDIKIDGRKIGSKKIFVFPEGRGSKGSKSLWLIHEYRLPDENICKSGRNYVLCHLKPKQDELCRLQTDDAGSIPEHLIQATMESLRKSTQHQNRPQFSLPDLLQLFLHGQQSQNNSFRSNINQVTNIGSSSDKDFLLDNGLTDKSIQFKSWRGTTKQHEWVDTLSTENRFHAEVQKGEAPRLEKVQQETAARNIEPWISSNEATARAEHLNQATMESLRKSAQHQNGAQYSFPYLLQPFPCGPQSQNNSFHSNINQVTNIGSLPANDFSLDNGHTDKSIEFESLLGTTKEDRRVESLFPEDLFDAKVQKGEEPRLEKVQQETAVRNIGPGISSYEAEARAKLPQHGLQSPNNSSSPRTTKEDECDDAMPDADLSCSKVQRGEEPRFEMVQQETGARNIEDEAAARAKLLQLLPHGLQSPNNSSSSTTRHFRNVGNSSGKDFSLDDTLTDKSIELKSSLGTTSEDEWVDAMPDADLSCAKVQRGEEPRLEIVQQETGARNIEDEVAAGAKLLQLLPHGLQSPNNSSSSMTHHFRNVGNSSDADLSCAKVQRGEEPRLEMVQQETGARNIEDEAAAGEKNGQIFITANRQSIVEPLNCVFPPEERKGIPSNPFDSSGFSKFSEFEAYFDQPADQEKGLDHEEDNLAGNSPKRRRLDVSEENQIH